MGLSPPIMNDILTLDENASYNLSSGVTVTRTNIGTRKIGFETISTIGAVLWQNLPNDVKNSDGLNIFKHRIKQWTPDNCPCKICRNFIKNLGFICKPHMYAPFPFLRSDLCSFLYLILEYLQVLNKIEKKNFFQKK